MLLWGKVAQMGQATSRPQVADGVDGRGPASANLIWLSGQQNFHSGPGEGLPPPLPLGELGVKLEAQLPALPHECILWAISPCCVPSSEVGQTSSFWGWREAPLNGYFSCEGSERRGPEGQGSGQLRASGCSVAAVRRELSTCSQLAMGCGPPSSALTPPLTKLERSEWLLPSLLP